MKKFLITFILLSAQVVCAQTNEKETLKQISQNAISAYQSQKFDDAIKFAQQAVDLSLKIYGAENLETAVAYENLGVIYRSRKKFKESIENLQKAVVIYESAPNLKNTRQVRVYEALAFSQILGGLEEEAEATYLKAIGTAESQFGKESKESFSSNLNLANLYARGKNFEKADALYLKSYALAIKNFAKATKEIEAVDDSRICILAAQGFKSQTTEISKAFYEEKKKLLGDNSEEQGILNKKAKLLPKPEYPSEAKRQRLGGSIAVRARVDEQGKVFEVITICGDSLLGKATQDAVRKAEFEPVLVDGKPIKYSGFVIYNYVP